MLLMFMGLIWHSSTVPPLHLRFRSSHGCIFGGSKSESDLIQMNQSQIQTRSIWHFQFNNNATHASTIMIIIYSVSKISQMPDYLSECCLLHQLEYTPTIDYNRLLTILQSTKETTMSSSTIGHAEYLLGIEYISLLITYLY